MTLIRADLQEPGSLAYPRGSASEAVKRFVRLAPNGQCSQRGTGELTRTTAAATHARMNELASGLLLVALAYLVGATPFGYLTGRLVRNIDIRQHGSGNIGATNVGRVLGSKWGLFVLVLDFFKGLAPVAGLPLLLIGAADP